MLRRSEAKQLPQFKKLSGTGMMAMAGPFRESGECVMMSVALCAEVAELATPELPLCALPCARHNLLLESYSFNLKRGKAAVRKMILEDLWRFVDLGAWERAADLLVVHQLLMSGCASPDCLEAGHLA
jgi:hypothetical protein